MRYKLYQGGEPVNVIISEEDFVSVYCQEHGYTYQEDPLPDPPQPEPEPTEVETLQAQVAELQAELLRIRTGG